MTAPELIRPPRLRAGDRVAMTAPSSGAPAEAVAAGVDELARWGLKVEVAPNVTGREPGVLSFLAGSDAERAREFERAWLDPDIRALICSRGGDGANRMAELVDWDALRAAPPKVLVGFSDITTLHVACAQRLGVASLHGPMPLTGAFAGHEPSRELLRRTLFEPEAVQRLGWGTAGAPLVPGRARGVLVGGCLSVFAAEFGTPHGVPDPDGAILCLEDVGENPTHLDRYLGQLIRTGYASRLAGIALGSWSDCGEDGELRELFTDRLGGLGIPVAWNVGFGHVPANLTLPFGLAAELDADAGELRLDRAALAER